MECALALFRLNESVNDDDSVYIWSSNNVNNLLKKGRVFFPHKVLFDFGYSLSTELGRQGCSFEFCGKNAIRRLYFK